MLLAVADIKFYWMKTEGEKGHGGDYARINNVF